MRLCRDTRLTVEPHAYTGSRLEVFNETNS